MHDVEFAIVAFPERRNIETGCETIRHVHLPIDNIILASLAYLELPRLAVAWSRLDDYGVYLNLQNRFREAFKPRDLLEVEFSMWMEARKQLPNSKSAS